MSDDRFERLTPRQRQCLRGVRDLRSYKEIAADLGIEESTVKGYIAEAVAKIGAKDRADAARRFAEFERPNPSEGGATFGGLAAHATMAPDSPVHAVEAAAQSAPVPLHAHPPADVSKGELPHRLGLPFARSRGDANDLIWSMRLAWIIAIPLLAATAVGLLAIGLQVFGKMLVALHLI